jgi:hypothetical protein
MRRLGRDGRHGSLEERLSVNVVQADSTKGNGVGNGAREVVGVDGGAELHAVSGGDGGEVDAFKGLLLGERVKIRRESSLVVPAHPVARDGKLIGIGKDGREGRVGRMGRITAEVCGVVEGCRNTKVL